VALRTLAETIDHLSASRADYRISPAEQFDPVAAAATRYPPPRGRVLPFSPEVTGNGAL